MSIQNKLIVGIVIVLLFIPAFRAESPKPIIIAQAKTPQSIQEQGAKAESKSNDTISTIVQPQADVKPKTGEIETGRFGKPFKIKNIVLDPLRQAVKDGQISKHIAVMIASLHVIESPNSYWSALGCNVLDTKNGCQDGQGGRGYGRFAAGLVQVMNYPEWTNANKAMGTNWTVEESLNDPKKQIDVISGLIIQKLGVVSRDKDSNQMYNLAGSWLGKGCDMHGTCTNVYAQESKENYEIIWESF